MVRRINTDSKSIEKYMKDVKGSINDNFRITEHVSATSEETSASTDVIVSMVESIKNMSDKLNSVVDSSEDLF